MSKNNAYIEEVEDFLGGTFHQDIQSPEQAMDEFILESTKECLLDTINDCEKFLNSDIGKEEKENLIQNNAEIYFPAMNMNPIEWLTKLVKQMKMAVETKN
ncbi:contact-dependent growth inhibition system immunity protein [Fictibacillus iocasae]|uniref:Contact-dependent growth inhibition system immunity protein n=1 Tax=Fictibacillus iocasae TaxID=2715437 RepID=A0ABW2NNI6_9BACL